MFENVDNLAALSGFFFGFLTVTIALYFNHKIGKKKRRFDERYHQMHTRARSIAWSISTFCIVGAWMASIFVEGAGFSFFILTFVYVAHMIAYLISSIVVEKKF